MVRERFALLVGISLAIALTVGFSLWLSWIPGLYLGGAAGAAALLALLYLPRFPIAVMRGDPGVTQAYFAHALRQLGMVVAESPGVMTVRIGRWAAAKVHIRPSPDGSQVSYQAYMTPAGIGAVATLLVVQLPSLAALPLILYLFGRANRFSRRRFRAFVPRDGSIPSAFRVDDVSVILTNGLAEGYRVAAEAYEAERETYYDRQGIVVLIAILTWLVVFAWLLFVSAASDFGARVAEALVRSLVACIAFAIAVALIVRRRFRPRLERQRAWVDYLRGAWDRERSRTIPAEGAPSAFEVLVEAAKEAPDWIGTRRRRGLAQDPGSWTLLFVLVLFAAELFLWSGSAALYPGGALLALGLGAGGVGLAGAAYAYYRRWKREQDQILAREMSEWKLRFDAAQGAIERYLEGL